MNKQQFKNIVADGLKRGKNFLIVKIETEGNPAAEIIINPVENVASKMAYYEKAYNDDLELIAAKSNGKSIRITDVIMTSNLSDLAWFVY